MPGIGLGLHDALVLLVLLVAQDGLQFRHRGVFDLLMVLVRGLNIGVLFALLLHRGAQVGALLVEDLRELGLLRIGQRQAPWPSCAMRGLRIGRSAGRRRLRQRDRRAQGSNAHSAQMVANGFFMQPIVPVAAA